MTKLTSPNSDDIYLKLLFKVDHEQSPSRGRFVAEFIPGKGVVTDDIRVGNRPAIKVTAQRELPSMKVTALRGLDNAREGSNQRQAVKRFGRAPLCRIAIPNIMYEQRVVLRKAE